MNYMKRFAGLVCAVAAVVFFASCSKDKESGTIAFDSPAVFLNAGDAVTVGFSASNIESFSITGKPTGWSDPVIDAANRTITVVSPEKFDDDNDAVKSGSVTLTGKVHGGSTASATLFVGVVDTEDLSRKPANSYLINKKETNYLIDASITSDYYDERVIGGKTGFTTPAGRCVMCVAESGNLRYLCVVLGASSTGADGSTYFGSFVSASEALDFGFDSFTFAEVLSPLAPIAQLPVAHATQSVVVTPAESVTTMLPKDYDKSLLSTRYQLTSEAGLDAPLEAGQAVGVVQEYYGSICVGQTDLVTVTGVERNAFGAVVMQVKGEIAQSPWQFVAIVLAVLLGIFLLLLIWSTWVRRRNRKRRQNRRKGN